MAQDSVADTRMGKFIARGFVTGTLADRSMALLTSKGAVRLTLADKQIELGQTPDPLGHVNPDLYP
jgi:hypothetical protein